MSEIRLHAQQEALLTTSFTPARISMLQQKRACGGTSGLAGALQSRHQKRESGASQGSDLFSEVPPIAYEVARSPGEPLDSFARGFMQPRFGHDFSQVRIHTDARAAEAAAVIGARAFTTKHDIVFDAGEYAPRTEPGRRLLSHELTHVLQQQRGVHLKDGVGQVGDAYETHADAVADLVVSDRPTGALLEQMPGSARSPDAGGTRAGLLQKAEQPIQMQQMKPTPWTYPIVPPELDQKTFEEWGMMHRVKQAMADKLAREYIARKRPAPKYPEQATPPAAVSTYSGGNTPVPIPEPDEKRVSLAIYRSLEKLKTGKGDKLTDWNWKEAPGKTWDDKRMDLISWGAKEGGKRIAEEIAIKKITDAATLKIAKINIELIAGDVLGAVAVATGAEIVGGLLLAWEIGELLYSLGEPAELTGWQAEDARIFADVRAYFQDKEDAANYKKQGSQFRIQIRNPIDETRVVIPYH